MDDSISRVTEETKHTFRSINLNALAASTTASNSEVEHGCTTSLLRYASTDGPEVWGERAGCICMGMTVRKLPAHNVLKADPGSGHEYVKLRAVKQSG